MIGNDLLQTLPPSIQSKLETRPATALKFGQPLETIGNLLSDVFFPLSGAVSLLIRDRSGDVIDTGVVGRNGAVNVELTFDGKTFAQPQVIVSGRCIRLTSSEVVLLAGEHPAFKMALLRHQSALLAESQQSVLCATAHRIEQRLCRWLGRLADVTGATEFNLTQEHIAQMLCVQRSTLSLIANDLQARGSIQYSRGHLRILDKTVIEQAACDCYSILKSWRTRSNV